MKNIFPAALVLILFTWAGAAPCRAASVQPFTIFYSNDVGGEIEPCG